MSDPKISTGLPQPQGIGEDPLLYFTKVFVRFLQVVFATFEKGSYKWEPDFELTDIIISDQGVLGSDVVEKHPAIVCMRGQADWSNISMNQFKGFEFETGKSTHTDLVSASMQYCCLAKEGLEAQRIAWIAGYATRVLKRNLYRAGMHRVGENLGYGSEEDADSLTPDSVHGLKMVRVSVPFFFQDTYSIAPVDNLLLKDLDLRLTSQVNSAAPQALRAPAIWGRTLSAENSVPLTQRVWVRDVKKK